MGSTPVACRHDLSARAAVDQSQPGRAGRADEARVGIMLKDLRLPTIKTIWPQFAERADREGWPA
ncbi:hypothetical protein VB636_00120, partial [Paracoccus sp. APAP_BH8]